VIPVRTWLDLRRTGSHLSQKTHSAHPPAPFPHRLPFHRTRHASARAARVPAAPRSILTAPPFTITLHSEIHSDEIRAPPSFSGASSCKTGGLPSTVAPHSEIWSGETQGSEIRAPPSSPAPTRARSGAFHPLLHPTLRSGAARPGAARSECIHPSPTPAHARLTTFPPPLSPRRRASIRPSRKKMLR